MKKLLVILMVLGAFALTSCNTMRGVGEDIEEVGDSVQDAIN